MVLESILATPAQVCLSPTTACPTDPAASFTWVSLFYPCLRATHPCSAQHLPSGPPQRVRNSLRRGLEGLAPPASPFLPHPILSLNLGCSQGPHWFSSISLAPSLPSIVYLLHCLTSSCLMPRSLRARTAPVPLVAKFPGQSTQ